MSRHHSRAKSNTALTRLCLEVYGLACWLRLTGCRQVATTRDHIRPLSLGGADVLENVRPACRPCNSARQDRIVSGTGLGDYAVVMGPPAAGKTTYVAERAQPGDVVIDLDAIAGALTPAVPGRLPHDYPGHVKRAAMAARKGALQSITRAPHTGTAWIIHAMPQADDLALYRGLRYQLVTVDPGEQVVTERAARERPPASLAVIARWYQHYAPALTRPREPAGAALAPATASPVARVASPPPAAVSAPPSGARPW